MNPRLFTLLISLVLTTLFGSVASHNLNQSFTPEQTIDIIDQVLGAATSSASEGYSVVRVIDGDTFKAKNNEQEITVRLVGIDTPETHNPNVPIQCYGKEATSELTSLISGRQVRLEYDSLQGDKDRYGRTLAYVYTDSGLFVNAELVRLGFAHAYTKIESDYLIQFQELENRARQSGLGLWSACPVTDS